MHLLMHEAVRCLQTLGDSRAAEYMKGRKTLEINPDHPIIQALKDRLDSDADGAKVPSIIPNIAALSIYHLVFTVPVPSVPLYLRCN